MNEKTVYCSFCGAGQTKRKTMLPGPDVAICNDCVFQSVEILVGDSMSEALSKALLYSPTPAAQESGGGVGCICREGE